MKKIFNRILIFSIIFILIFAVRTFAVTEDNQNETSIVQIQTKPIIRSNVGIFGKLGDLKKKIQTKLLECITNLVLGAFRSIFGDFPQTVANSIESSSDGTKVFFKTMYSYDELKKDGKGSLNKYTNVGTYEEGAKKEWQKVIDVTKKDVDDTSFDKDTEIPVMKGDWYNIAVNHISLFDINFLTGTPSNKNSIWLFIRNFAAILIRISFYIACAILLSSLIVNGIRIIMHATDSPEHQITAKSQIERLASSVALLLSSILIMGLCIFGTEAIYNTISKEGSYELPIRVNVESAGYSFSTTIAGYMRYMYDIQDLDRIGEKFLYVFAYIILSWVNLAMVIIMFFRVIALWGLSIAGPITAALNVFGINGIMDYRIWVRRYVFNTSIQVFLILLYKILLEIAI